MNYRQEYEKWVSSPAITDEERAELRAIADDDKEIESRFYGPLEFGTAGLRGTMKMGLHQMNVYVIRWATQGFAKVICAEGEEAKRRGVQGLQFFRDDFIMDPAWQAPKRFYATTGLPIRADGTNERGLAVLQAGPQGGRIVAAAPRSFTGV